MPIASKLLYFQRRPSPAPPPPPDQDPEPPGPRRRPCRGSASSGPSRQRSSLSHHHKRVRPQATPGQELVPGNQRDGTKFVGSAGNIIEYIGGMSSSSRLNHSVSDHGRLPDAVQQARERLLQRLNSVDSSGRRLKTPPSEWAGVVTHPADLGISTSADSILTSCFQSSVSIAGCKVQESSAEPFSVADEHVPVTPCSEPVPKLHETTCEGANECEITAHSVECSICLERCGDADGLIQLSCKHVFHSACLERWLRSRSDCPYCRTSVRLTSDE